MDIDWHIGDVITKMRRRRRLNQTALAKVVGVNKATIVRAEDGDLKVSRETYLKIANALQTTLAALESEAARLQWARLDGLRYPPVPFHQPGRQGDATSSAAASPRVTAAREYDAENASLSGQNETVSPAASEEDRRLRDRVERITRPVETPARVEKPAAAARTAGKHAAATRAQAATRRTGTRKSRG